ncbi:MAG: hypothetical protein RJA07_11 [Bacteroidota bacterium]|jgi:hypothetical protein
MNFINFKLQNIFNQINFIRMKKITLFIVALIALSATSFAQKGNLILFAEEGERFTVVMNGIQQNASPETNVAIRRMPQGLYIVKIIFEDKDLGVVNDKINILPDHERTFNIRKKKETLIEKRIKNEASIIKDGKRNDAPAPERYVIRIVSDNMVPLNYPPPPPNERVIIYDQAPINNTIINDGEVVHQTTTTTTTTSSNPDDVNINMNVGGLGGSINVNTNGMGGTTTTRQTTTVTHTSTDGNYPAPVENRVVYVEGYNGPIGCPRPMNQQEFESAKQSIGTKTFEDSKLQIAKQIVGANCCTAAQVRSIMKLFTFEQSKLDFAKFAYKYTYDQKNYYKVNDAFEFESSISDLNTYLNGGE